MPELEGLNPGATQHLARTAQLLEELEGQHNALEALALEAIRSEPGSWELDRQRWQEQPIELQKRLLHRWVHNVDQICLLYTSPSPRDVEESRMPSSA